ncbi:Deoxynucleoside kinase [Giardia duodenalis]|uniref:Deoxynucleoside kinase n=1 Tax=Giardia intestinalis (strain ATCC 50803 / WB clone C6) TaxID=184922 RepID=A0A644FAT6_GIAIC|nr:Deoxynucleoside kinase [Giardia intestinalis]KAE8305708.1 Deoxynucleoside kinase [Giardia intestinalis]
MSLYYEPQNQPGTELVRHSSLYYDVSEELLEVNSKLSTLRGLSLARHASVIPPACVDPRMIVVDGPIGAGKSLFCRRLVEHAQDSGLKAVVIEEVVGLECFSAYGITLDEYYRDPHANAYRFQLAVTHALADQLLEYRFTDKYKDYDLVIFDRWLPSTSAFVLFQVQEGHITGRQAMYLHYLIDVYMSYAGILPATHVRFATDPLICAQRIVQRAAEEEHRQCEEDALGVVSKTNEFLLKHKGVYTPVFNLNHPADTEWSKAFSAGNQFSLVAAARVTRQYVVENTLFLGEDRRYFVQIGMRRINAFVFFNELCDWTAYGRFVNPFKRRMQMMALSFDEFQEVLARDEESSME